MTTDALPRSSPFSLRKALPTALVGLAGVPFLLGGAMKLAGAPQMVQALEGLHYPRWFVTLLGALELAGAAGLLFRRTRVLAVAGFSGIAFGAIATHVAAGDPAAKYAIVPVLLVFFALGLALDPSVRFELSAPSRSRARRWAAVALAVAAAALFVMAGGQKLLGSGIPAPYRALGALELLGAAGLLIGRVRVPAAFGLAAILHGAVATHVVKGDGLAHTAVPLLAIAVLYAVVALEGRLTVRVDGVPAWRRFLLAR
jgi:uncharacterized membrane protein YphA (DoxX/SURF4 family)